MENIISDKKLKKYIRDHNYSIKDDTLQYILNNLKKKSSKFFLKLNQQGGTTMASEFYGVNSGAYSETLSTAPTEVSTPKALSNSTRPAIVSEEFPLQDGGCSLCSDCNIQSGGCVTCGIPQKGGSNSKDEHFNNKRGGCIVCKNLFSQKNIKDISKLLNLKLKKNQYNQFNNNLSNNLKKLLHSTFNEVKNKDKLIGKSHFMKALKGF